MNQIAIQESMGRNQRRALVIGVLLSAAGAALGLGIPGLRDQFFNSYLVAFMLWVGLSLGALALICLHNLTGGRWGKAIRPTLESAAMTMPLMVVLFLPILAGMHSLYDWTSHTATNELVRFKMTYWLNSPMFIGRSAVYLLLWSFLGWMLARRSRSGSTGGGFSAAALLIYFFSINFAAIDWVMSMHSEWYSTIYGMLFMTGQAVSALAWAVVVLALVRRGGWSREIDPERLARPLQDLGNLMLTFVMLWAYMAFSQYLIIWSGDVVHETPWYVDRLGGGWKSVGATLLLLHFAVPFVLLLQRSIKRHPVRLAGVGVLLLVMRLVDMIWLIQPNLHASAPQSPAWGVFLSPVLWLGLGGLWTAVFLNNLKNRPLPVLGDEGGHASDAKHVTPPAGGPMPGEVAHG